MDGQGWLADRLKAKRARLRGVAYRLLGSPGSRGSHGARLDYGIVAPSVYEAIARRVFSPSYVELAPAPRARHLI
jgi:hypothetical protein